jgi:spermidine synthase
MSDKSISKNGVGIPIPSLLLGIFLISASGLMLEVTLTRIFSATIWYHYAFIAISVALFGWGLGGFLLHILKEKKILKSTPASLATASLLFSLSIPVFLWIIIQLPATPKYLNWYFITSVIPFFLAGITLAQAFDIFREITGKLYFADLIGASFGALGITLILGMLGGESTVLFIATLPALATLLFSTYRPDFWKTKTFPLGLASILAVALLIIFNSESHILTIKNAPSKGLYQHMKSDPKLHIVFTQWNSYSRIDGVEGVAPPHIARIYIDSDAWTNVVGWDGETESMEEAKEWFRYIPFHLEREPKALIIGPGGGVDVLLSLVAGGKNVTAVELNPIIVDFVRHYGEKAGNIYNNLNVNLIIDEGRNFISRSNEKYDVISLSFVDSWASVSSGGLALSENYLYTTQAFHQYFEHLTNSGIFVVIRWQVDIPRLVSNSISMMREYGIPPEEAGDHIAILLADSPKMNEPTQMIFMLKKTPFTKKESVEIKDLSSKYNPVHIPYVVSSSPYKELFGGRISPSEFYSQFDEKVDPIGDDSPFYFANEKPYGIPTYLMRFLLIPISATFLFFAFSYSSEAKKKTETTLFILYFIALGLGFIFIEISILQKFILLLGHPIFTLSVILFSLLVSGGIGSFLSGRFKEGVIPKRIFEACSLIFVISIIYAVVLPHLIPVFLPFSIGTRIAITFILILPLGLLMGMPFPLGIRIVGNSLKAGGIPFYWGLNGIMSVFGSIAAIMIGVGFGFTFTTLAGSASYLLASICAIVLSIKLKLN